MGAGPKDSTRSQFARIILRGKQGHSRTLKIRGVDTDLDWVGHDGVRSGEGRAPSEPARGLGSAVSCPCSVWGGALAESEFGAF